MADSHKKQIAVEGYNASLEFARLGIRATFILNGGAIIAIMTFLGHIYTSPGVEHLVHGISLSSLAFIFGVVCASVSFAIAFFSQGNFNDALAYELLFEEVPDAEKAAHQDRVKAMILGSTVKGYQYRLAAVISYTVSLISFLVGSIMVYLTFSPLC